ncbi:hypothetical protein [Nonomuraea dietziae]|uniref:hypothetical protein n=1 Tax=Nonomuraea dietziae TaxID=65515 RepID=UPI0031D0635F
MHVSDTAGRRERNGMRQAMFIERVEDLDPSRLLANYEQAGRRRGSPCQQSHAWLNAGSRSSMAMGCARQACP